MDLKLENSIFRLYCITCSCKINVTCTYKNTVRERETEYKSCFFHLTNHHVMPLPIHIINRNSAWRQSQERVQSCNSDSHHHRHVISVSFLAAQVFLLPMLCILAPKYTTVIQGKTTHSLQWCWHSWRQSIIGNSILPCVGNSGLLMQLLLPFTSLNEYQNKNVNVYIHKYSVM